MQYPIFIHKDPDSDYGVTVPDLPGCFSAGKNIQDAMQNAREAIECHLEGLLADNDPIPLRKPVEQHLENPDYRGGLLALVEVDLSSLGGQTTRINVSMPGRFLKQIDEYAHQHGGNRSGFLLDAAMNFMAEHPLKDHTGDSSSSY